MVLQFEAQKGQECGRRTDVKTKAMTKIEKGRKRPGASFCRQIEFSGIEFREGEPR